MIVKFLFWAQALDNLSPDHINLNGIEISPDDVIRRQEAVSLVANVVKRGIRIFDRCGVQLTEDGRHFVLEITSAEKDSSGRTAPIVCCGDYEYDFLDDYADLVMRDLDDFAERIGRTIPSTNTALLQQSFISLKKKRQKKRVLRSVLALVVCVIILLFCWLALRDS